MKCAVCGKEFGTGSNCKHCGSDKFTGLGNYSGYNAPVVNDNTQVSFESAERQNLNSSPQPDNPGSIICYACGEIIPSDSKFCPYCSTGLFVICPKCGQPITEIASDIADKATGAPMHFDCVLEQVKQSEPTGENEKIAYIGQGRFAVLYYENIRDQRHFTIKKIIEWESREQQSQWREELSGLYSKIN